MLKKGKVDLRRRQCPASPGDKDGNSLSLGCADSEGEMYDGVPGQSDRILNEEGLLEEVRPGGSAEKGSAGSGGSEVRANGRRRSVS